MGSAHTLVRLTWATNDLAKYTYAHQLLEEAMTYSREAGDKIIMAFANQTLGSVSWFQDHDTKQARIYYESSLSLFGKARYSDASAAWLADIERTVGNVVRARMLYEEALIVHSEHVLNGPFVPYILAGLACIAKTQRQFERAAVLLGHVYSILGRVAGGDFRDNVTFYGDIGAVREQLGETAFAEMWAQGKAMPRKQAIAFALEGTDIPTTASTGNQSLSDPLNARELGVLSLVADGLSNREIARELYLSVNTVKWYLKGIFGKLDVTNRAQAVSRAQKLGLWSQD